MMQIDIFPKYDSYWIYKNGFEQVDGRYGTYYTKKTADENFSRTLRVVKRHHIKYRYYNTRWARSSDYRKNFFKAYPSPYRCRYCHRWLKKEYMVIDHIVPVNQTKKSRYARFLLTSRGINTVNDVRNLAPSCSKCNRKKSDHMGIWLIRAALGKYEAYWAVRRILMLLVPVAAGILAYRFLVK